MHIFPVAAYGCEAWTFNKAVDKHICAFEYKCYRRVIRTSSTEKRTNRYIQKELKIKIKLDDATNNNEKIQIFWTYKKT